ncbi:MAG: chromosome segregation protein SMC [Gammaproteobacteria bacterium]|nr:chromosome segregation protein SMC [Gammaproteobacteria bacterium]MCW8839943.1 chromosome segregation protein SMC [Gammaproteobacteria bacterium]MCW8958974.1 chromosome segregation protein SMC [Gammaproteobacteria bacterium]MCW8993825.1 chromosome segregation protein SMC [Gammaproteobacteria bacterium]
MRLSKIKLAGFKSFVDPTTLPLPTNLTGIVGPNGCGKSNTIDAVRWVMGESSAKHLRGDSMTDVIFNGSNSRKPVGQASIELTFDNSDGTLGGQYANYNEIAIKRTVTRDGQSLYHLNGTRCRRRDITDIFLGTGLGPRSYAIIEQGTISRIIEAKPEELRVFLEEAAGISKYKERRRETENRIRHTRDNLDRLNDLRDELDKQLSHLQRQATTAERYKELRQEERTLKGQLQALRWRELDGEAKKREHLIHEQETGYEAQVARQRNAEANIESRREAHVEASEHFNTIQSEYYGIGADIARMEQTIQHERERYQQQRQDLEQLERGWNEAQVHQDTDTRRIDELQAALSELEPQQQRAREAEELSTAALAEAEQGMQTWQTTWEQFNQEANEPSQSAQVEKARIQHLERQVEQLNNRLQRIDEEQANLSGGNLDEELEMLREQLAEGELRSAGFQERLNGCLEQISKQREQNHGDSQELDALRTKLQSARGRHASLEALQQAALGKRQGAVSEWLEGNGLAGSKRLAEGLRVDEGWERAAECVLGDNLEAVCVEGMDPVLGALDSLEHGSLALFDTTNRAHAAGAAGETLLSKVSADWPLDSLLAGVYLAEDLQAALALRGSLAAHESVITREGVWLGNGWLRVARDADERAGVLHREQELKELSESIAMLEGQVETLHQRMDEGHQRQKELEAERETIQADLNEANRRHTEQKSQLSAKQARQEQIASRRERLQSEAEEIRQQLLEAEQQMASARKTLHASLERMEELAQQREELAARREVLRDTLEQSRQQARQDRDTAQALTVKLQTARTELESTRQGLERMNQQLGQLAERREELKIALAEGDEPIQLKVAEMEELLQRRMEVEARLTGARRQVGDIEHAMRELENERHKAEQEAQNIRNVLEQQRMAWQELKVRRQTLQERVAEAGFEIDTLLQELPEQADLSQWESQLDTVTQRIQRLGPINLAAIDEYEQQSERKKYLDAQNEDLTESLETLENAIRKIDRETRTRFKETFDLVNKGLQDKFPRLFGGGHAYLELTGDDLLDTGVTVMARPPGKRNSTIHLLSGGEKALTAVALVFSIFELNPSPFCMLDEVDAPLDEANVGRFCKLVKEMSEQVQFIYITHNKTTMELATTLTGVTMHEPGVSRIVAVDVDEAIELAAV